MLCYTEVTTALHKQNLWITTQIHLLSNVFLLSTGKTSVCVIEEDYKNASLKFQQDVLKIGSLNCSVNWILFVVSQAHTSWLLFATISICWQWLYCYCVCLSSRLMNNSTGNLQIETLLWWLGSRYTFKFFTIGVSVRLSDRSLHREK